MKLAEKFGLPVFTFVDTPGAYPGIGAEERGQSEAIGRNIFEMAQLEVPIISTIIGEGGSGGMFAELTIGGIAWPWTPVDLPRLIAYLRAARAGLPPLEAMACGLPVVTTLVGGNAQVVCDARLGLLVPFGEPAELEAALDQALQRAWDAAYLRTYAENNAWDSRIELLVRHFHAVSAGNPSLTSPHA